jgi:arylsulfatase A-like enzyme
MSGRPTSPSSNALLASALLLVGAVFSACTCGSPPAPPSAPTRSTASTLPTVPNDQARTLALAVDVPFATLELPPDSRPHAPAPPARIPLQDWRPGEQGAARTDNPIRTRNLYFHKPSPGMIVERADGTVLPHRSTSSQAEAHWTYDRASIKVHGWEGLPAADALFLVYPQATELEQGLNLASSGLAPEVFARATVQAGDISRSGLLLPAPGLAAWEIEVPPAADLRFAPALIQPEIRDGAASDGAHLTVTLTVEGQRHTLWEGAVRDDGFEAQRVDLAAFAGKRARLEAQTTPGADNRFDYVFLADPVIASRKAQPRRVVLVFVDTLRVDHVSAFGYHRDTTPALDKLADRGVRFSQARNVAPWTLPSTRSLLTGNDPERYFDSDTLQGRLRAEGFATAMFAGNIYLGANFGLNRDWGTHFVELLPSADAQLDRALAWLDEHEGRDSLLLVHLMDAHLPYKEPKDYRRMYAGDPPDKLKRDVFHRPDVVAARLKTDEERQYIRDRYDNNIRFTDDQLARLYDRLGPDDVLVFFSDHGEEFWDHDGFEHGHTLHEELLRVPLVLVGPGLDAATVDAPVSLLDVMPTVLDLLGLPHDGMKGSSLLALARGDATAAATFKARPQAFGRPLYGDERWGVLDNQLKYTTVAGAEDLYDLGLDPEETEDLRFKREGEVSGLLDVLGTTLGRPMRAAFRFSNRGARKAPAEELVAVVTVPGGIEAAWVGDDPTSSSAAMVTTADDGNSATITWLRGFRGSRNVWVVPKRPIAEVTRSLSVTLKAGDQTAPFAIEADKPDAPNGKRVVLGSARAGERGFELGFGLVPLPDQVGGKLVGYDPELAEQLKAMGYAVGNDEP